MKKVDRHVVVGAGNLGIDLVKEMHNRGLDAILISKSKGFKYPCPLEAIMDLVPDHIWCCVGAGSVEQAHKNYLPFLDLHVRLVVDLVQYINPQIRLHFFSTDYVANEKQPQDPWLSVDKPKSLYTLSKLHMENTLRFINRPNTFVYRVGTLYGEWKKCFPTKLKNSKGTSLTLPSNRVTPTPTKWLAKILVANHDEFSKKTEFYHVAPLGNVTVHEWGTLIDTNKLAILAGDIDPQRPKVSNLGCSFNTEDTWREMWELYKV